MATNNMMRIAIAGSGGLARIFAQYINETVHPFIILSRNARPELEALGYQVIPVNYDNQAELRYNLRGIDLVISTISGNPQINLMDAAAHSGVRRFVPADYEGLPARRPRNDPLDRGRAASLEAARHWVGHRRHPMPFTVFCCGVFYERFARGGLISLGIGASTTVYYQGSYLMDVGEQTAQVVENNAAGQPVCVVLTSVYDLARFMVAALDLEVNGWPEVFRMQGDRRTVAQIVQWAEAVRGAEFRQQIIQARDLVAHLDHATYYNDYAEANRIQELIVTEQRRYDFGTANLNQLVGGQVTPMGFWEWLYAQWGTVGAGLGLG